MLTLLLQNMLKIMHKTFRLLILVFLIISGACNRCPSEDEFIKPSSPKASWLIKFLESPTCQPPCWENIIPGETTISDAMDLLRIVPYVQNISPYYPKRTSSVHIEWEFVDNSENGRIHSTSDGKKVESIYFDIRENMSLSLGNMIGSYGSPSYMFISLEPDMCYCMTGLAYEAKGMVIYIHQLCKVQNSIGGVSSKLIKLTEETSIYSIFLSSPHGESWYAIIPRFNIEWNGYGEYEDK
jgi:hypothetical protein